MASKLALRTLGAIALPGAFLAMAAPAASAAEVPAVAPLSNANAQGSTTDTATDAVRGGDAVQGTDAAQGLSGLMGGRTIEL